jgi:hypothetical protein
MWLTRPTSSIERGPSDNPVMRGHSKLTGDAKIRGPANLGCGNRRQFSHIEFGDVASKIDRADVHAPGQRVEDEVDHKLARIADVPLSILVAVAAVYAGARRPAAQAGDRDVSANFVGDAAIGCRTSLGASWGTAPRKALLVPYSSADMVRWPVSSRVGNVKNNDASLIGPIPEAG